MNTKPHPQSAWTEQPPNPGSLHGLRVVDASRILGGPLCAQILGDHGADVLKVEGPEGDDTRKWGPPFQDGMSAYFSGLNRNKRIVAMDLSTAAAREELFALLEDADVLVENFKPSTSERWGLSRQIIQDRFPHLIHCRITGFGADGPLGGLPAYDTAIQGLAGLMSVNGDKDAGPMRVGLPVVDMTTGLNAALAVLLALHERTRSGKGQYVEAALFDSALSLLHPHAPNYFMTGERPQPSGNAHPSIYPYDSYSTQGAPIYLAVGNDAQFMSLCRHLDRADIAQDARFASNAKRSVHRQELRALLALALQVHDGEALADALVHKGVPCAPIIAVDQALEHPQTKHRGMVVSIGDSYRGLASPIRLQRTPASYRLAPPAMPVADTRPAAARHAQEAST